jgi:hypothetical protein
MTLIDKDHIWKAINHARIFYSRDGMLNILTSTDYPGKEFNRAVLQTQINNLTEKRPLLLSMKYASKSFDGKATFVVEIRDNRTATKMWDASLSNTNGSLAEKTFILPNTVINKQIKLIVYIITDGPGEHDLSLKNATMQYQRITGFAVHATTHNNTNIKNNTYILNIAGKVYPIKYQITGQGNKVKNITTQIETNTLRINLSSSSNGTLTIQLPKNIIDAKKQGNTSQEEDTFFVLVDSQMTGFDEIKNTTNSRTLSIDFDKGSEMVEILGTDMMQNTSSLLGIHEKRVVPEFQGIAQITLGVTITGIILAYSRYNNKLRFFRNNQTA